MSPGIIQPLVSIHLHIAPLEVFIFQHVISIQMRYMTWVYVAIDVLCIRLQAITVRLRAITTPYICRIEPNLRLVHYEWLCLDAPLVWQLDRELCLFGKISPRWAMGGDGRWLTPLVSVTLYIRQLGLCQCSSLPLHPFTSLHPLHLPIALSIFPIYKKVSDCVLDWMFRRRMTGLLISSRKRRKRTNETLIKRNPFSYVVHL